jgi:hypothetical protein
VESFPTGYPELAAWVSSDPNFTIYRQYKYLRNRCLLYIQDELADLESRLNEIDEHDAKHDPRNLTSRETDDSQKRQRRKELVAEIKAKLKEYGKNCIEETRLKYMADP